MPSRTGENPRPQHDRDRHVINRGADESRNPDARTSGIATPEHGPHAGFDAELNPIDDDSINTHGSER
jgi:hypothetical protein